MNVLITGACGQLGRELTHQVARHGTDHIYFLADIADEDKVLKLDITNKRDVEAFVNDHSIDCIVNCAAYTNVDKAEDDADMAHLLNSTAVRHLADAMRDRDGILLHISTDYVFGGSNRCTPLSEDAQVCPTGVYGRTKLEGEQQIAESKCRAIIIRTAWLYSPYGKNFVKTMMQLTDEKPELKVVIDQVGTPTYAHDLAKMIYNLVENESVVGNEGTYHYSNEGVCSWYDFAHSIAQYAGHNNCRIEPCRSDQFPSKVKRPAYSVLDKSKIKQTFGISIPHWTDSLQHCLSRLNYEQSTKDATE